MSERLKRIQSLPSSKTTVASKNIKVEGFAELVKQLQNITVANQKSHEDLVNSINQLSKVIVIASDDGVDTESIVDAISGLKDQMAAKKKGATILDYVVNFDRDSNGLMKSGIRMSAEHRKLN